MAIDVVGEVITIDGVEYSAAVALVVVLDKLVDKIEQMRVSK